MPIGKYKDQPISEMTTPYLMWLVTNDLFRFNRWELVESILGELKCRFEDFDNLKANLQMIDPPVAHWKEPYYQAKKAKLKNINLVGLEQRRAKAKASDLHQKIDRLNFVRNHQYNDARDLI